VYKLQVYSGFSNFSCVFPGLRSNRKGGEVLVPRIYFVFCGWVWRVLECGGEGDL
jgi:hypothetical protein